MLREWAVATRSCLTPKDFFVGAAIGGQKIAQPYLSPLFFLFVFVFLSPPSPPLLQRRRLHAQIATWFERVRLMRAREGLQSEEDLVAPLAFHYQRAGQDATAKRLFVAAARAASSRGRYAEAVGHLDACLRLFGPGAGAGAGAGSVGPGASAAAWAAEDEDADALCDALAWMAQLLVRYGVPYAPPPGLLAAPGPGGGGGQGGGTGGSRSLAAALLPAYQPTPTEVSTRPPRECPDGTPPPRLCRSSAPLVHLWCDSGAVLVRRCDPRWLVARNATPPPPWCRSSFTPSLTAPPALWRPRRWRSGCCERPRPCRTTPSSGESWPAPGLGPWRRRWPGGERPPPPRPPRGAEKKYGG